MRVLSCDLVAQTRPGRPIKGASRTILSTSSAALWRSVGDLREGVVREGTRVGPRSARRCCVGVAPEDDDGAAVDVHDVHGQRPRAPVWPRASAREGQAVVLVVPTSRARWDGRSPSPGREGGVLGVRKRTFQDAGARVVLCSHHEDAPMAEGGETGDETRSDRRGAFPPQFSGGFLDLASRLRPREAAPKVPGPGAEVLLAPFARPRREERRRRWPRRSPSRRRDRLRPTDPPSAPRTAGRTSGRGAPRRGSSTQWRASAAREGAQFLPGADERPSAASRDRRPLDRGPSGLGASAQLTRSCARRAAMAFSSVQARGRVGGRSSADD